MYMGLMMSGRHKYIAAEPLVPQPIAFEVERAIEKLNNSNHEELI